jgi:hypothetical protein
MINNVLWVHINNLRTYILLAYIKFIRMSFRNKKKRESLVRFSFLHLDEYKSFYIFPTQCMYIVFILQHHKIVKFTHKKAKTLNILVEFPIGWLDKTQYKADIMSSKCRFSLRFMIFSTTFNNISVMSWRWVLMVEETRVPGENHRPTACHWQTLSHNVVSSTPRHERGSNSQLLWC